MTDEPETGAFGVSRVELFELLQGLQQQILDIAGVVVAELTDDRKEALKRADDMLANARELNERFRAVVGRQLGQFEDSR